MGIKKGFLAFFALLILASQAYAQDFSLSSGKFYDLKGGEQSIGFEFYDGSYSICEYDKKTVPILIANNGNAEDKYALSASGAGWARLNAGEFSLQGRQNGAVFLNLMPAQDSSGVYNVKLNAVSSSGVKRELSLAINVGKCYSLSIELENENDRACGGIKRQYNGEIANNGGKKIEAALEVKGPNWVDADKNSFSIDANHSQRFALNADIPANANGLFKVALSAGIKGTQIKAEKTLAIDAVQKYDCYKADILSDAKITNYFSNEYIPIKIKNSGIKNAEYDISLEAPEWVYLEPDKISLNPGQSGNLNLNINPNSNAAEGTYPIKLNAKFGGITYSKNIDIALKSGKLSKKLKSFFAFYRYYIYLALSVLIILLILRKKILNRIKSGYKNYKIRKTRIKALEAARKAKQLKKQLDAKETEFKIDKPKKHNKTMVFLALLTVIAVLLFFSYKFGFPISRNFVKSYYQYMTAGILISIFIVFLIEFYKPLLRLLKKLK